MASIKVNIDGDVARLICKELRVAVISFGSLENQDGFRSLIDNQHLTELQVDFGWYIQHRGTPPFEKATLGDQHKADAAEALDFRNLVEKIPKLNHLDLGCQRCNMEFPSTVFEYEAFPSVLRLTLRRWSDFGGSKSIYNQIDHTALEHLTLENGYVSASAARK
ncbi:MAG: hypothetical protein Q9195_009146 [Heterodermia aff. obscurata]